MVYKPRGFLGPPDFTKRLECARFRRFDFPVPEFPAPPQRIAPEYGPLQTLRAVRLRLCAKLFASVVDLHWLSRCGLLAPRQSELKVDFCGIDGLVLFFNAGK